MKLTTVATACAVECERQKVGLIELGYLLNAYSFVSSHKKLDTMGDFYYLGELVEPQINRYGFRSTPVIFQNGGSSCMVSEIYRKMEDLINFINTGRDSYGDHAEAFARKATSEFLWIHPFADGNGRIGFLLYNYLLGTLDDPKPLPDFNW